MFWCELQIQCKDVVLEDTDVAKAIIEYAANTAIENIVVGASAKSGFLRHVFLLFKYIYFCFR